MMKRRLFFGMILLCGTIACEQDLITYKGPYHVRFTESSASARESFGEPINIQVHNAGPAVDEDISIKYLVSGDAREGVDYIILGDRGHVVIPAGEYFGNIQIQLINNSNNILRSQEIVFELRTVDNPKLEVGEGKSARGTEFTFTIFDDCILGGYYYGKETALTSPVHDLTITSSDCETYVLSDWDINFFGNPFDMPLEFIDNGDNTLTVPPQEDGDAKLQGIGVVDPITGNINFTIAYVDDLGSEEFSFTLYRE